jgi:hypothetical protein
MKFTTCYLAITALFMVTFSACKKDDDKKDPTLDSQVQQFNKDSQDYKSESDQADNDINSALKDIPAFGKFSSTLSSPLCGVTIDSSQISQKIVFFNFDGVTPCFSPSRTRSGQIKVQLTSGNLWSDVNAELTLTYINFKITRLSDNKSITFNGVKTLKNLNGNNWLGFLLETATLKYKERALNIQVAFDNGSTAVWNSARITEWSYKTDPNPIKNKIIFTAIGDTTINGYSSVDSWGVNRFAQPFTTYYTVAYKADTYCGLWRPTNGQLTHHLPTADYSITLGVDQSGNPSPYDCAYGFKIGWSVNGNPYSVVISY